MSCMGAPKEFGASSIAPPDISMSKLRQERGAVGGRGDEALELYLACQSTFDTAHSKGRTCSKVLSGNEDLPVPDRKLGTCLTR